MSPSFYFVRLLHDCRGCSRWYLAPQEAKLLKSSREGGICNSKSRKQTMQRVEYVLKLAGQSLCNLLAQRKVRAPQSRMPVNDRTPRGDGKCHREQTAQVSAMRTAMVKRCVSRKGCGRSRDRRVRAHRASGNRSGTANPIRSKTK